MFAVSLLIVINDTKHISNRSFRCKGYLDRCTFLSSGAAFLPCVPLIYLVFIYSSKNASDVLTGTPRKLLDRENVSNLG